MKTPQALLKQFAASVTVSARKLSSDTFIRTEGAIIGILFLLCALYVGIVSIASYYFHLAIAAEVISNVAVAIADNAFSSDISSEQVLFGISEIRKYYLEIIVSLSLIITILFGYVLSRIVLSPTKKALTSQKQFIGKIAHELRTPLAVITANQEITNQEYQHDQNILEMTQSNLEELKRISDIIDNLLTLSSLTNTEPVPFEVVDLSELFRKTTKPLFAEAAAKRITVSTNLSTNLLILANKSGLTQIICNLFKNAIIYTHRGGNIHISITAISPDIVRLNTTDNGVGIEQVKIKKIFNPFYQAVQNQNNQGSGLGLSIVSELVRLHHGKITVQTDIGVGTSILVDFPLYVKDNPPEQVTEVDHTSI